MRGNTPLMPNRTVADFMLDGLVKVMASRIDGRPGERTGRLTGPLRGHLRIRRAPVLASIAGVHR